MEGRGRRGTRGTNSTPLQRLSSARPGLPGCCPCERPQAKRWILWGWRSDKLGVARAAGEGSGCGIISILGEKPESGLCRLKCCTQAGWSEAEQSIISPGRSLILNPPRCAVTLPAIRDECANPAISAADEWGFVTRLLEHVLPRSCPHGNPVPRSQFALPGTRRDFIRAGAARDLVAEQQGGMSRAGKGREHPWAQRRALPSTPSSSWEVTICRAGDFQNCSVSWQGNQESRSSKKWTDQTLHVLWKGYIQIFVVRVLQPCTTEPAALSCT